MVRALTGGVLRKVIHCCLDGGCGERWVLRDCLMKDG